MTEREALKLTLEALVEMTPSGPNGSAIWHKQMSAITAASEALAQPEPCRHRIADIRNEAVKSGYMCMDCGALFGAYTTPPQRTWVGLTHSDIDQGLLRSDYAFKTAEAWRAGVVFAMNKLKEKNT